MFLLVEFLFAFFLTARVRTSEKWRKVWGFGVLAFGEFIWCGGEGGAPPGAPETNVMRQNAQRGPIRRVEAGPSRPEVYAKWRLPESPKCLEIKAHIRNIYIYICMYTVYTYVLSIYIYTYVYTYIYRYIYICIYIHRKCRYTPTIYALYICTHVGIHSILDERARHCGSIGGAGVAVLVRPSCGQSGFGSRSRVSASGSKKIWNCCDLIPRALRSSCNGICGSPE